MPHTDCIIRARWLIPVVPEGQVLENHAVWVTGGRIRRIAPGSEIPAQTDPATIVDLPDHALIPGLVNTHTHAAMTLLRGLADDLPLMTWLQQHIWPAEGRWVDRDFVRDGTSLAIAEMFRCGTTCFNDMYFFPGEIAECCVAAGMRCSVGMIVLDHPTVWAESADDYIDKGLDLRARVQGESLITTAWAPHAPYTVGDKAWRRIGALSKRDGDRIHTHLHESAPEIEQALETHGKRPFARLAELGLNNDRLLAVHMTQLLDEEIEALAMSGGHVVHCPESNLKLASGFAPLARLDAAGISCALGTDGAASNNDLDMFGEMKTAALLAKGVEADASAVPAARILTMATLGGARALGLGEHTGSLETGKAADMVAVDLGTVETTPIYNPISQLVYAAGRHQVSDVWVAGRQVLAKRELQTLDAPELCDRAGWWRDRIVSGPES